MNQQPYNQQMPPCGGAMNVNARWLPVLEGESHNQPTTREIALMNKLEEVTARFEKATEALEQMRDEFAKYFPSRDQTPSPTDTVVTDEAVTEMDTVEDLPSAPSTPPMMDVEVLSTAPSTPTMAGLGVTTPEPPSSKVSSPMICDAESESSWEPVADPVKSPFPAVSPFPWANGGLGHQKMTQEDFSKHFGMDDQFGQFFHGFLMKRALASLRQRAERRNEVAGFAVPDVEP